MGQHSKPTTTRRNLTILAATGAFAAVPLTPGVAGAETTDPWAPIIACESGGNAKATNPDSTASGLFQFLNSTWASVGGTKYAKRAKDATAEQQREMAERLFAQSGLSPWAASKSCWSGKTSESAIRSSRKPSPKPRPAPTGGYVVKGGDTLARIAAGRGFTWQQLWEANRAAVANPNVIHVGQRLTLPVVGSAPAPASNPPASTSGGPGERLSVRMTGYSFQDNTPANSNDICCGVVHKKAGGTGTWADPITVAVPGSGGKGMEFPAGTKFYAPTLKRYLIVEDSGATDTSGYHLDVYVDGQGLPRDASDKCMNTITSDNVAVIKNPGPGQPVTVGPLTGAGGCRI